MSTRRRSDSAWLGALAVLGWAGLWPDAPSHAAEAALDPSVSVLLYDSSRTGNFEIYATRPDGSTSQLTADPALDSIWPKLSPDGRTIVFHRTPRGVRDRDYTQAATWVMDADGSRLRPLVPRGGFGWGFQAHAEWSPDGSQIAMIGGSALNTQIFVLAADGTNPRRVTRAADGGPRGGVNIDPSWAPDGRSLLFTGCPVALCFDRQYEIYRVGVDGSGEIRLTTDSVPDYDAYWAPDGSAIAWLRNTGSVFRWGVFIMRPDGTGQAAVIDDGGINSKPEWAPDSTTIYFHRSPPALQGSPGFNLYRIDRSGRQLTRVLPDHGGRYENDFPEVAALSVPVPTTPPAAPPPSVQPPASGPNSSVSPTGVGGSASSTTPSPVAPTPTEPTPTEPTPDEPTPDDGAPAEPAFAAGADDADGGAGNRGWPALVGALLLAGSGVSAVIAVRQVLRVRRT